MTQLDCNVKSCCHNADNCCCKSKIEVDGSAATNCGDTCCGSYDKRSGDSYSNRAEGRAVKATEVDCKATNCLYNVGGYCDAGHIGIIGETAQEGTQTECGSFQRR